MGAARRRRGVVARDEVPEHVDAVVGVQMTEEDRVEVVETAGAAARQGRRSHVEEQPEAVGLDEVARAGRVRGRKRPRAADDGELHKAGTSAWQKVHKAGTGSDGVVRSVERKAQKGRRSSARGRCGRTHLWCHRFGWTMGASECVGAHDPRCGGALVCAEGGRWGLYAGTVNDMDTSWWLALAAVVLLALIATLVDGWARAAPRRAATRPPGRARLHPRPPRSGGRAFRTRTGSVRRTGPAWC